MADKTGIEWTDATWNPIVGCSIVSKGCTNCYAMKVAARMEHILDATKTYTPDAPHHYRALTKPSKAGPVWTGRVNLAPDKILTQPLRWTRPRRIFVNSMSDLFHESVPDEWIDKIFAVIALTPEHTYQILTKRPERMSDYIRKVEFHESCSIKEHLVHWSPPLPNVWLGVSVEDQRTADERIPYLLETPAAARFVSCEPLLEPVDLDNLEPPDTDGHLSALTAMTWQEHYDEAWKNTRPTEDESEEDFLDWFGITEITDKKMHPTLDWVIVGGESGKDARPMHPDWVRAIRDQCASAGVPFLFKQWGEWAPGENCDGPLMRKEKTAAWWAGEWSFSAITPCEAEQQHAEDEPTLYRVGKRKAGRRLDGIIHDAYPEKKND